MFRNYRSLQQIFPIRSTFARSLPTSALHRTGLFCTVFAPHVTSISVNCIHSKMAAPVAAPVAVDIEGTISSPAAPMTAISSPDEQFQTLNEPVLTTIMRDVRQISLKLRYVLIPTLPQNEALRELRNWDLWGPLVLCLVLSFLLSYNAAQGQAPSVFAAVFVLVWAGR